MKSLHQSGSTHLNFNGIRYNAHKFFDFSIRGEVPHHTLFHLTSDDYFHNKQKIPHSANQSQAHG
jgi:hypothetical protein